MAGSNSRTSFADARSDQDQLLWVQSVVGFLRSGREADAADLGFSTSEIERLAKLAAAFDEMFQIASNRGMRTHDDVARKDFARDEAMAAFRLHANRIKADPRISQQIKIWLGIKPPEATTRSRVPAPTTSPLINIRGGIPGQGHLITVVDSTTPDSRKKPHGVAHMQMWMAVTSVHSPLPEGPNDPIMRFVRNEKAAKFTMPFKQEQLGMIATYMGRWETRSGLLGPWSMPVSMAVIV